MEVLDEGLDLDAFFDGLGASPSRLLFLDYDGTLAPFRVDRNEAFPYEGVRERLSAMVEAGHTRVVVVSGRSLSVLEPLLGLDPAPELWGSHGWERRPPGGDVALRDPGAEARAGLEAAREEVGGRPELAGRVERKPVSVAVHVRGLDDEGAEGLIAGVRSAWARLAEATGLEVHDFDGGLEVRVPGWDKGSAVRTVLDESPPGTVAAYLGDDLTDEDAFAALAGRGLPVLVRTQYRPTRADLWLRPPDELLDFLRTWDEAPAIRMP